jgi:flagellar motor switch protein FliG
MTTMLTRKYTNLTGAQKAALLVLTVGDVQGGKIFALLHEDEIREISRAMVQIGPVPAEMIENLVGEFSASVDASSGVTGSIETTQRVLAQNLSADRVAQIMEEIAGPPGRTMWDRLGNVDESVLAAFLKNEYPQTIAVVLSKLKPERAAKVLSELPSPLAIEVVMRLLKMETVQKDVLEGVERTLQSEFMANLNRSSKRDPHELMAGIFNNLDRKTEIGFLEALEKRDQDAAERIRSLMFTFEDLVKISSQGIQLLLRSVQKDRIALALKGAPPSVMDAFFNNLSDRAGKMLREDMERLGPVKMRDVDESRAEMVRMAKELASQGRIEIKSGSEEEVVY